MQVKASLNNIRIAPRKARLVTGLVKGMQVDQARAQLAFLVKKPAPLVLKLLNSAIANAKNNFNLKEENLYIQKIYVDAGPTLKRWLPRAQGRATPIMKRTCSVNIILGELVPTAKKAKKSEKPKVLKQKEAMPEREEKIEKVGPEQEKKPKSAPKKRYEDKSKQAPRQGFGNIKKIFRRKSV